MSNDTEARGVYIIPTGATVNSTSECLDLCDRVAGMLKAIGFKHAYTSMQSEACYYAMPGHSGLLRLVTHKNKQTHQQWDGRPVVAKLTFTTSTTFKSEVHFMDHIAKAVGRYMLAHANLQDADHWRPATECAKPDACQHPYCRCPRQEQQEETQDGPHSH